MRNRVLHFQPDEPAGAPTVEVTVTPAEAAPSLSDGELVVAAAAGAAVEASRNATETAGAAAAEAGNATEIARAALARAEAAEARATAAEARAQTAEMVAQAAAVVATESVDEADQENATELEVEETPPATTPEPPKERPGMFARLFLGI